MKLVLLVGLTFLLMPFYSQVTGTVKIQKERSELKPVVYFAGLDAGHLKLRDFLLDKCLEPTLGVINKFEVIVEDSKGNWKLVKNETGCFTGANYDILKKLSNGSQIEFINIMGYNEEGDEIIFPGMKFVIRK
jgi:hypothetical protein